MATHFVFGSRSKFEPDGNEGEISIYDRNLRTEKPMSSQRRRVGDDEGRRIRNRRARHLRMAPTS